LWTLIEALLQDEALATKAIAQESWEAPVKRMKRLTQQLQSRLLSLCVARRDNKKTAVEVLEGLKHIIRFGTVTILNYIDIYLTLIFV